jgi:hypothetical protein
LDSVLTAGGPTHLAGTKGLSSTRGG